MIPKHTLATVKNETKERTFIHFILLKEERAQKISTLVFTLVALSLFGLFAISPTLSTISKLKKELSDSQFVNEKLQNKIESLGILQGKYSAIQSDLPYVVSAIPQTPRIAPFTGKLQALALQNHITTSSIQIFEVALANGKPQDTSTLSFAFAIAGNGSYENCLAFLGGLNTLDRITTLDTVSFTNDALKNNVTISIKGKAYFKK